MLRAHAGERERRPRLAGQRDAVAPPLIGVGASARHPRGEADRLTPRHRQRRGLGGRLARADPLAIHPRVGRSRDPALEVPRGRLEAELERGQSGNLPRLRPNGEAGHTAPGLVGERKRLPLREGPVALPAGFDVELARREAGDAGKPGGVKRVEPKRRAARRQGEPTAGRGVVEGVGRLSSAIARRGRRGCVRKRRHGPDPTAAIAWRRHVGDDADLGCTGEGEDGVETGSGIAIRVAVTTRVATSILGICLKLNDSGYDRGIGVAGGKAGSRNVGSYPPAQVGAVRPTAVRLDASNVSSVAGIKLLIEGFVGRVGVRSTTGRSHAKKIGSLPSEIHPKPHPRPHARRADVAIGLDSAVTPHIDHVGSGRQRHLA